MLSPGLIETARTVLSCDLSRWAPAASRSMVMTIRLMGLVGFACWVWTPLFAQNAEPVPSLRVLSSNGVMAAFESVQKDLEQAIGLRLDVEFSTAAALARRIEGGEAFDVAILTPGLIDALIDQRAVTAASRTSFARAGVGVGARPGEFAVDLDTAPELERFLLESESIAFTADGQSRRIIDAAFERMGIADDLSPKVVLLGPGEAPGAVAAGQAQVVLTLMSEIVSVPGLVLLGPFPDEVQGYVDFAAGIATTTTKAAAAAALIEQLGSSTMKAALTAHGLEAMSD
jgi:molybdate transport system substrate-binding protein